MASDFEIFKHKVWDRLKIILHAHNELSNDDKDGGNAQDIDDAREIFYQVLGNDDFFMQEDVFIDVIATLLFKEGIHLKKQENIYKYLMIKEYLNINGIKQNYLCDKELPRKGIFISPKVFSTEKNKLLKNIASSNTQFNETINYIRSKMRDVEFKVLPSISDVHDYFNQRTSKYNFSQEDFKSIVGEYLLIKRINGKDDSSENRKIQITTIKFYSDPSNRLKFCYPTRLKIQDGRISFCTVHGFCIKDTKQSLKLIGEHSEDKRILLMALSCNHSHNYKYINGGALTSLSIQREL